MSILIVIVKKLGMKVGLGFNRLLAISLALPLDLIRLRALNNANSKCKNEC